MNRGGYEDEWQQDALTRGREGREGRVRATEVTFLPAPICMQNNDHMSFEARE